MFHILDNEKRIRIPTLKTELSLATAMGSTK